MPGYHTFTAGEVLTAGNMNTYLMGQAVIQTTSGARPSAPPTGMVIYQTDTSTFLVYNGTAWVQFTDASAVVTTSETTTSTSFTSLTTPGPSVQVYTNTRALVTLSCLLWNQNGTSGAAMSVAVSGATTIAAATNAGNGAQVGFVGVGAGQAGGTPGSWTGVISGLTAGLNVFTMQYEAVSGNTAQFVYRSLTAVGLP